MTKSADLPQRQSTRKREPTIPFDEALRVPRNFRAKMYLVPNDGIVYYAPPACSKYLVASETAVQKFSGGNG
jgi:hypothetical protein